MAFFDIFAKKKLTLQIGSRISLKKILWDNLCIPIKLPLRKFSQA